MPVWLRALIFTIVVPGTLAGLCPWLMVRFGAELPLGALRGPPAPWHLLGWPPALLGAAGYLRCVWEFVARGHGTPAPWDAPRRFVASGLYRVVRNPMYVSVGLVLAGESLLYRAPVVLLMIAVLWPAFHVFVTRYEEPHLRQIFGPEYEDYLRRVRRWVPGLPR